MVHSTQGEQRFNFFPSWSSVSLLNLNSNRNAYFTMVIVGYSRILGTGSLAFILMPGQLPRHRFLRVGALFLLLLLELGQVLCDNSCSYHCDLKRYCCDENVFCFCNFHGGSFVLIGVGLISPSYASTVPLIQFYTKSTKPVFEMFRVYVKRFIYLFFFRFHSPLTFIDYANSIIILLNNERING